MIVGNNRQLVDAYLITNISVLLHLIYLSQDSKFSFLTNIQLTMDVLGFIIVCGIGINTLHASA